MSNHPAKRGFDLNSRTRWYVVANRTDAVFYTDGSDHKFHFVERLSNPEGRLKEGVLDSDKPGRSFSSPGGGTVRHSLDRRNKHHEESAKTFAMKIAQALESARREDRFAELVLTAEPHFLGLIREALSLPVRSHVKHEIGREYVHDSEAELRSQILLAIENENKKK